MQQQENRVPLDTNRLPYRKSEYRGVAAAIRSTHPEGLLGSSPLVTAVKTAATEAPSPEARQPLSPLDNLPAKSRSCTPEVAARIRGVSPGRAKALALGEAKFQEFKARKARASRSASPGLSGTPAASTPGSRYSASPSPAPSNASLLSSRTAVSRISATPPPPLPRATGTGLPTPGSLPSINQNRSFASSSSSYAGLSPLPILPPFARTPSAGNVLTPEPASTPISKLHSGRATPPLAAWPAQRAPKLEAAAFESVPIGDDCNVEAGDKENAPPEAGAGAAGEGPAEASKNWSYKMRLPIWPVTVTMGVAISGADSPAGAKPEQPLESICCHSYPTPQQPSSRPTTPSGSGRSFEPPPLMLAPIPAIKAPTSSAAPAWGLLAGQHQSSETAPASRAEAQEPYTECALFAVAPSDSIAGAAQHSRQPQFQSNPLFDEPEAPAPQSTGFRFPSPASLSTTAKQPAVIPDTPRVWGPKAPATAAPAQAEPAMPAAAAQPGTASPSAATNAACDTSTAAAHAGPGAGSAAAFELQQGPIRFVGTSADDDFSFDLGDSISSSGGAAPAFSLALQPPMSGIQHMAAAASLPRPPAAGLPPGLGSQPVAAPKMPYTSAQIRSMFGSSSSGAASPAAACMPAVGQGQSSADAPAGQSAASAAAEPAAAASGPPPAPCNDAATARSAVPACPVTPGAPSSAAVSAVPADTALVAAARAPSSTAPASSSRSGVLHQAGSSAAASTADSSGCAEAPAASWVGADLEASPDMQLLFENQQMKQERDELRAELRRISERLAALETMTIKTGPKGRSRSAPRKAKGGSQGGSRPASPFVQPAQRTANQELAGQAIQAEHAQRSMHPSMRAGSTGRLPQPGAMSNPFQSLQYPPGFNSQAQASPGVQGQSLNAQAHDAVHRFTGVEYCMDAETGSEQSSLAGSGIQKQDSFASELAASSGPVPHNGRRRRNRRGRSNTPPPRLPEQPPVVLTQPSAALFTQELPARQPGRPEQGSQGRSRSNGRRRNRSHTPEMLRHAGHAAGPQHAQRPQGQRYSSPNLMPSQGPQYQASTAARPHSRNGAGYGSKENANPGRPAAGQAFGSKVSSAAGTAALLGINLSHSDFQPQSRAEGMNQAQRGVLQESNSALRATAAPFQLPYAVGNTQGQLR